MLEIVEIKYFQIKKKKFIKSEFLREMIGL
jgi:hypothetical protein